MLPALRRSVTAIRLQNIGMPSWPSFSADCGQRIGQVISLSQLGQARPSQPAPVPPDQPVDRLLIASLRLLKRGQAAPSDDVLMWPYRRVL